MDITYIIIIFFGLAFYGQSVKLDRLEKDIEKLKSIDYSRPN